MGISNIDRYQRMWHSPDCFPLTKRLLSNDGGGNNPGNDGPVGVYGRVETGIQSAEFIADKVIENNMLGFEFLSHSVNWVGRDEGCGPYGYLDALEAMGRKFGTIPIKREYVICSESKGKINQYCPSWETMEAWPWEGPPPICDIHKKPEPPPPPKKPCGYYFRRLNWKRWWKCIWGK